MRLSDSSPEAYFVGQVLLLGLLAIMASHSYIDGLSKHALIILHELLDAARAGVECQPCCETHLDPVDTDEGGAEADSQRSWQLPHARLVVLLTTLRKAGLFNEHVQLPQPVIWRSTGNVTRLLDTHKWCQACRLADSKSTVTDLFTDNYSDDHLMEIRNDSAFMVQYARTMLVHLAVSYNPVCEALDLAGRDTIEMLDVRVNRQLPQSVCCKLCQTGCARSEATVLSDAAAHSDPKSVVALALAQLVDKRRHGVATLH